MRWGTSPTSKRFQTSNSSSECECRLSEEVLEHILKEFHAYNSDVGLENRILKWHPITSNIPPSPPLDEFLRGVLEENNKYVQIPDGKLLLKMHQKNWISWIQS